MRYHLNAKTARYRSLTVLSILLSGFLVGCGQTEDAEFTSIKNQFFRTWSQQRPVSATWVGHYQYNHLLGDYSQDGLTALHEQYREFLDELEGVDQDEISSQNQIDLRMLRNGLNRTLFMYDTVRIHTWNPLMYIQEIEMGIAGILLQSGGTDSVKASHYYNRLQNVPGFVQRALIQMDQPSSLFRDRAVIHADGLKNWLQQADPGVEFSSIPSSKQEAIRLAQQEAASALAQFTDSLQNMPASPDERIWSASVYQQLLSYTFHGDQNIASLEQRVASLLPEIKQQLYDRAAALADRWWNFRYRRPNESQRKAVIRRVKNRVQQEVVEAKGIADWASNQISQLREFSRQHKIIDPLPEKWLKVNQTPGFIYPDHWVNFRATGPIAPTPEAYVFVAPMGSRTVHQTDYFLNRFARQLDLINLTVPGAYILSQYVNQYPSMIRAIFPSVPFNEGWQLYCEQMMIEAGWNKADERAAFIQALRTYHAALFTLLELRKGEPEFTREDGINLLTREGYLSKQTSAEVWQSAQLHPAQFTPAFVGSATMQDLRIKYKRTQGQDFTLVEWHKRVLGYGSVPLTDLKMLITKGEF